MPRGASSTRAIGGAWPAARGSLALLVCLWAGSARAQVGTSPPLATGPVPTLEEGAATAAPPRPRMSLAVGFGASLDATGFGDGTHAIPAFFGQGGFGDGVLGFELGAFSTAASGRFHASDAAPIDRLGLDGFFVIRPAAGVGADDVRYGMRVLRILAAEVGLGYERDGRTSGAGSRFQIHTGARIELPLTPAGRSSELRLRLGFRRAIGLYTPQVAGGASGAPVISVRDSNELYAALAVVF
ncbi:MAG TPA: hypothetical protein VHM31_19630 [Polyangia bacterium]|nr:hypothetical protein [Polyangia bacterium]